MHIKIKKSEEMVEENEKDPRAVKLRLMCVKEREHPVENLKQYLCSFSREEARAIINFENRNGKTPFHHACQFRSTPEAVHLLLQFDADINSTTRRGHTRMCLCACAESLYICVYLVNGVCLLEVRCVYVVCGEVRMQYALVFLSLSRARAFSLCPSPFLSPSPCLSFTKSCSRLLSLSNDISLPHTSSLPLSISLSRACELSLSIPFFHFLFSLSLSFFPLVLSLSFFLSLSLALFLSQL